MHQIHNIRCGDYPLRSIQKVSIFGDNYARQFAVAIEQFQDFFDGNLIARQMIMVIARIFAQKLLHRCVVDKQINAAVGLRQNCALGFYQIPRIDNSDKGIVFINR